MSSEICSHYKKPFVFETGDQAHLLLPDACWGLKMGHKDIVDSCYNDELGRVEVKAEKDEPGSIEAVMRRNDQNARDNSNAVSSCQSGTSVLEQGQSPADDAVVSSSLPTCPPPICRQFWKAGNYNDDLASKASHQNGKNYLHVHPMFLHSNATSHKWAFGAIAELIDNSFDEIHNGASFVIVDKTINPRDGSRALLIQDDGSGMDPEAMRRCMSFGFSDKKSQSAVGRYGNGFKTSTMRLGADVIVFSRHINERVLTQSIGLLSYSFLTQTGHDRIVVPMVDYEFDTVSGTLKVLHGKEHVTSNLSLLLQWSPYATEEELLKQFDDIGSHGTRIIIYNLWVNDDGNLELDFDSDPEDIRIHGDTRKVDTIPKWREVNEQYLANRYHYSLRAYLSILYLRVPESFRIELRGQVVAHHNIADDLKYMQYIMYKPQTGRGVEAVVVTTIGFLKEAPKLNMHGFNVYHKNRLILPFWPVVSYSDSRGRVVGVLEANFVEPNHNKQDFERTSLLQKLEGRLKEMTWEYWDYHCGLIGYQPKKKHSPPVASKHVIGGAKDSFRKRKESSNLESVNVKKQAVNFPTVTVSRPSLGRQPMSEEAVKLIEENKKLLARCSEHEKRKQGLELKITRLKVEVGKVQSEFQRLLAELKGLNDVKGGGEDCKCVDDVNLYIKKD
ncbi:protein MICRORCHIDIA 6-like [Rutidosis leptorrhynchoides]|uniref:protein MICRORCHIDIA 6-like n=1 Tax=Rutidosis leptorrhynchoides TaxID=125765 RepID=UPI003A9943CC